nr:MAG TPA: hypothetical protein [Caudoviricetes sp.]
MKDFELVQKKRKLSPQFFMRGLTAIKRGLNV